MKVIPVGEKNQLKCFAILMKYETSIILGCHSILVSTYNDVHVHRNDIVMTFSLKNLNIGTRGLDVEHQSTHRDHKITR